MQPIKNIILIVIISLFSSCSSSRALSEMKKDGLHGSIEYGNAASSKYPYLVLFAKKNNHIIECNISISGIRSPTLLYEDYNGDGTIDIVWKNKTHIIVITFVEKSDWKKSYFEIIEYKPESG